LRPSSLVCCTEAFGKGASHVKNCMDNNVHTSIPTSNLRVLKTESDFRAVKRVGCYSFHCVTSFISSRLLKLRITCVNHNANPRMDTKKEPAIFTRSLTAIKISSLGKQGQGGCEPR